MDCSRCKTSIGIKEENPQNNNSVRFFKDKISTDVVENNSILKAYSVETRVASELMYLSQLHQTFKFALCSSITGNVVCLIVITHWENHISCNNRSFLGSELVPILKLQFYDCLENQKSEEKLKVWQENFKFESILIAEEECFSILHLLNDSNSCLPPNKRIPIGTKEKDMKVGFLRRFLCF